MGRGEGEEVSPSSPASNSTALKFAEVSLARFTPFLSEIFLLFPLLEKREENKLRKEWKRETGKRGGK